MFVSATSRDTLGITHHDYHSRVAQLEVEQINGAPSVLSLKKTTCIWHLQY